MLENIYYVKLFRRAKKIVQLILMIQKHWNSNEETEETKKNIQNEDSLMNFFPRKIKKKKHI